MELYLLAELKTISLKVTTVDMQKPPPDFRTNFEATPPPILIDRGMAILENEKIERHIMKSVPGGHNLFVQVGIVCLWLAMKRYTFSVLSTELIDAVLIWLKHWAEQSAQNWLFYRHITLKGKRNVFDYYGLTPTPFWYKNN